MTKKITLYERIGLKDGTSRRGNSIEATPAKARDLITAGKAQAPGYAVGVLPEDLKPEILDEKGEPEDGLD